MPKNFHRKIILLILVLFLASNAIASSPEAETDVPLQLHPDREVSIQIPVGYSNPSAFPYGFQQKDLAPPFSVTAHADPIVDFSRHRLGIWANGGLYFLHTSPVPILDFSTGMRWNLNHYYFTVGGQITDQSLATEGPSSQSQFNTTYYGVVASAGYVLPEWDFNLRVKAIFYHDTPAQSYEGIETEVAHEATEVYSPTVTYFSPFGVNALAGMDIYQFGRSAVASKEFGYAYAATTTVRLRAGVSYELKPFEFKVEGRFVLGSPDPLELSYRAIFLNDDYLLSPTVIYLGAAWHF